MPSPFSPFPQRPPRQSLATPPRITSSRQEPRTKPPTSGSRVPDPAISCEALSLSLRPLLILLCGYFSCPENPCQAPFQSPWWLVETPTAPALRIAEISRWLLSSPPARTGTSRTSEYCCA